MIDLDDPGIYEKVDPANMRGHIREFPQECLKAWRQALAFKLTADYSSVNKVVILGMGGSAIGGDLLSSLHAESKVITLVHRGYDLPEFVDANTLVIAASYSGMTEETLSSFTQALAKPAMKLAITSGGELKNLAEQNGIPVFTINYSAPPRAALAHSLFPLLGIFRNIGLVTCEAEDITATVGLLNELQARIADDRPLNANAAKQLATKLYSRIAVIYGADILSPVAQRWKTQFNENSKAWAFYEVFPELNHNSVVGYEFPAELTERIFVVLLRSPHFHRRIATRYEITTELLKRAGVSFETVDGCGESALSQMLSLVLLGDWVSYYLSLLYETDPYPVEAIDYLKKKLEAS